MGAEPICQVLQIAPTTYWLAKTRLPCARKVRDAEVGPKTLRGARWLITPMWRVTAWWLRGRVLPLRLERGKPRSGWWVSSG